MADTLRVAHVADLHIGLARYGSATGSGISSRVIDFLATLERFVDEALIREASVVVFAGDTFNTRHEGPWVRAAFARQLQRLNGKAIIVCPGNHDGMTTVGDPGTHSLRWLYELRIPGVIVPMQPLRSLIVPTPHGAVNLTAYPYPHKRGFDEVMPEAHPADRVEAAGRALEAHILDVVDHLRTEDPHAPRLFVGHLSVGGSLLGSEQSMKFQWDVAISPHVLDGFDYAALGHIHRQQALPGGKAWYAGSPEYVDFSEADNVKGFLFAEVKRGEMPVVEVVPSNPRPMQHFVYNAAGPDGQYVSIWPADLKPGAIVKVEFKSTGKPDMAQQASIERAITAEGASFVKATTVATEAPAPTRIEVDETVDVDIAETTRRYLVANGHPEEPAMTAARRLIAAVAGGATA